MPPFIAAPSAGKGGQPAGEVGPTTVVVEVTPNIPSSILAKRKKEDIDGSSGHKNLKAPIIP